MDPIKDGGNWYQYCSSNPATYRDPTGLKKEAESKQEKLSGSEMELALFWRRKDFFQGHWWQNEEKLKLAYDTLLEESESRHMTITTLAEDYNYYDGFGYANTRLYTLQELIGDERTGIYNASTMRALQNVYISQGVESDIYEPELTPDNLREFKNWYDNENELMKQGAYQLENGWGDIFKGFFILGIGIAYRDVEVPTINENTLVTDDGSAFLNDGLEEYGKQSGHHPMAKNAFEGVKGYDSQTAISISNDKLSEFGVKHSTIT